MNDFSGTKVLLVDGGDRQTLPLAKTLKKLHCTVSTLCSSKLDVGFQSRYVDEKILDKYILVNKENHFSSIRALLEKFVYDIVITTSDDTAEFLTGVKREYEKYDKNKICVVHSELFKIAYDKSLTMKMCMDNDIPCPKTFFGISNIQDIPVDSMEFPIVVKPKKGYGAMGYHRFDTRKSLLDFCKTNANLLSSLVFQEYIPQTDIQYECAIFMDFENEVCTACVFSKNRWFPIDGGSSTCNVTVERPDIVQNCIKLMKKIKWYGAADIDLIQDPRDGIAKIMEINPRVSGSVKVVLNSGVNIVQQMLELALGKSVSSFIKYRKDVRMRCLHTDFLWFLKSPNRFRSNPNWFSWKNTCDQIFDWTDPIPFLTFSLQALIKYKREMKKRAR